MRVRLAHACLSAALLAACDASPERGTTDAQISAIDAEIPELDAETAARDSEAPALERDAELATDARVEADAGSVESPKDAGAARPLGMNDVTILTPAPANEASSPVLLLGTDLADDGKPFVPRALFDRLAARFDGLTSVHPQGYAELHLVAVRLDLCERAQPGPCKAGEDGRLRLVFQQFSGFNVFDHLPSFMDTSFHALYTIPSAELAASVAKLRELAAIQNAALDAPLRPSPALSDPSAPVYARYAAGVRKFVKARALDARLAQLALNSQPQDSAQVRWVLRGLERGGDGSFQEMAIAGSSATALQVIAQGVGFELKPAGVAPEVLGNFLSAQSFGEAAPAERESMLGTLLAADNPLKHATGTVSCVVCHTATALLEPRARQASIDTKSLAGGYTSTRDLSIDAGVLAERTSTLRALGFEGWNAEIVISRRVVNETAQVLDEIAQRYP